MVHIRISRNLQIEVDISKNCTTNIQFSGSGAGGRESLG